MRALCSDNETTAIPNAFFSTVQKHAGMLIYKHTQTNKHTCAVNRLTSFSYTPTARRITYKSCIGGARGEMGGEG